MYDLCFIGAGPSTMFSLVKLMKEGYSGDIVVIEKGKSLRTRQPTEVVNGSFGAGAYSDSKLSSALDVGGVIPGLTQKELSKYEKELVSIINEFNPGEPLNWDKTNSFDTKDTSLEWNTHNTLHVGTDRGKIIYSAIEEYLRRFPNITFMFEKEVIEVVHLPSGLYEVIMQAEPNYIISRKVILATGQKNTLPSKVIENLDLKSHPRAFQIGIRVEDQMNAQYKKIIKANYDFKFVREYHYDGIRVRVRTFCCNSGNAHTCEEKNSEGFSCFNGHAFKTPDPNNNTVNYGIMCEIDGLVEFSTKESQIKLMKDINALPCWKSDNFDEAGNVKPSRTLLSGFRQLEGYYPKEVILALEDFVVELNKIVNLSKAHYLYPETKLSGNIPELNYKTFETKCPGLYMIGDCAISRGIVKSSYTGWKLAEELMK